MRWPVETEILSRTRNVFAECVIPERAGSSRVIVERGDRVLGTALEAESRARVRCGSTTDHAAADSAFLARQRPVFHGR